MKRFVMAVCLAVLCAGCTEYYKVIDPSTGKTYYTNKIETRQGATMLKDARTGNQVTIQNSEVDKINKEEFDAGKYAAQQPAAQQPAAPMAK